MKRRQNSQEAFAPTQPLHEHQERLQLQRRWGRVGFRPNQLSAGARIFYGVTGAVWLGWAAIGIVSGHMFILLSRQGPLHLSGLAAALFCGAVLLGSALCVLQLVDHYDRRDNEVSYRTMRRRLLWGAAILFFLALMVSCSASLGSTAGVAVFPGWMDTDSLVDAFKNPWLVKQLSPAAASLNSFLWGATFWLLGFIGVAKLLLNGPHVFRRWVAVALTFFVGMPLLAAFTLNLLLYVATGDMAGANSGASSVRPRVAFALSMLIACLGAWVAFALATAMAVARAFRKTKSSTAHPYSNE